MPSRTCGKACWSGCSPLTAAGLVNYPTEWWHWSFGDRYWALLTGAAAACYDAAASTYT